MNENYYDYNAYQNSYTDNSYIESEPMYLPPKVRKQYSGMKKNVLKKLDNWVEYGMLEARKTSYKHALREITAISYLMGMGYPENLAHLIVQSWEKNENYYT